MQYFIGKTINITSTKYTQQLNVLHKYFYFGTYGLWIHHALVVSIYFFHHISNFNQTTNFEILHHFMYEFFNMHEKYYLFFRLICVCTVTKINCTKNSIGSSPLQFCSNLSYLHRNTQNDGFIYHPT
jgi:hypothetical protein